MFKKNKFLYIAIVIMTIFTFVYFSFATKISYAFDYNPLKDNYNNKIKAIKKATESYVNSHPEIFEEKDIVYISVNDLINDNFIIPDDEKGNIKDPRSEVKNLNNLKIRLSHTGDEYSIKILTEEFDK